MENQGMDDQKGTEPQSPGDNYRAIALKLRELAWECRSPRGRQEILDLVARFDRRAEHFDRRAAGQRRSTHPQG
jgi:hypothetical protein